MATLLQLRRMVRNRLGVSASDAFFRDDAIDDALNQAVATLEAERNWPWQLRKTAVTTAADGSVTLPANFRAIRSLYVDVYEVPAVPAYELDDYGQVAGGVQVYSLIGNELHVRNIPEAGTSLSLLYYRAPNMLNADTDSPDLPVDAYPAIVAKAAQLCSTREDDRPSATAHLLEYTQWVDRLRNTGEANRRPVGRRIRPGNWV